VDHKNRQLTRSRQLFWPFPVIKHGFGELLADPMARQQLLLQLRAESLFAFRMPGVFRAASTAQASQAPQLDPGRSGISKLPGKRSPVVVWNYGIL
jgi:hypothetical protein